MNRGRLTPNADMKWLRIVFSRVVFCASLAAGGSIETLAADEPRANDRAPAGGWKLADLQQTMKSLRRRSYSNGRRLFERAHCSKCHRLNNAGVEFGPDLAKLDPQFKPLDILRDILDPARRIADAKYDVWIFETDSGRVVTGLIVKRTEQTLEVMEKPPGEAPPVVLQRSEIDERWMSLGSIMPRGLLDEFTRDEIADLVAYVAARGNPSDPLIHVHERDKPPAARPAAEPLSKCQSNGAECR
jgi:putative heme-binding domain-containing protein